MRESGGGEGSEGARERGRERDREREEGCEGGSGRKERGEGICGEGQKYPELACCEDIRWICPQHRTGGNYIQISWFVYAKTNH